MRIQFCSKYKSGCKGFLINFLGYTFHLGINKSNYKYPKVFWINFYKTKKFEQKHIDNFICH